MRPAVRSPSMTRRCANPRMRRAAPVIRSDPSHGQRPVEPLTKPLSAKDEITDNAPRGSSPTSLLNHETSDHLLSRLEAMPVASPPGQAIVDRWPEPNVSQPDG